MCYLFNLVPKHKLTTSSNAQLKIQQFVYFNTGVGDWGKLAVWCVGCAGSNFRGRLRDF